MEGKASVTPMAGSGMKLITTGKLDKVSSMKMSANVDYEFATKMREHHQGAITMSQTGMGKGKDPAMRIAARKLMVGLKKEIVDIDRWIDTHQSMASAPAAK